MIALMRVDDRLLHGQVAFSWLSVIGAKAIVIANDQYASNPMLKMSLTIGKPPGVELLVLDKKQAILKLQNQDVKKAMLIVQNIEDAYEVAKGLSAVKEICIGGVRDGANKRQVYKTVYLNEQEIEMIADLIQQGMSVYIKDVPISKKIENQEIIKKFRESR